jgi:hypothetical protein
MHKTPKLTGAIVVGAIVITFRLSSVVRPSTFHILIFSSETIGPIATKLWWNGPWMAPFLICIIGIYRLKEKFHKKKPRNIC